MKRSFIRLLGRTIPLVVILLLGHAAALATAPNAPVSLGAQVYITGWPLQPMVAMQWQQSATGSAPLGYNIYQASGIQSSLDSFVAVGYVADSVGTRNQIFSVWNLSPGDYSFHVTAFNGDGESGASNIVSVHIPQPASISFSSTPPTAGTIGVPITYDANASATDGSTVTYSLLPVSTFERYTSIPEALMIRNVISPPGRTNSSVMRPLAGLG